MDTNIESASGRDPPDMQVTFSFKNLLSRLGSLKLQAEDRALLALLTVGCSAALYSTDHLPFIGVTVVAIAASALVNIIRIRHSDSVGKR